MSWGRCILCQKDSIAPLLNPSVPFLVGMLAHLNELQEGDGIIQNLKKEKAKWHKNCTLGLSASKYVK